MSDLYPSEPLLIKGAVTIAQSDPILIYTLSTPRNIVLDPVYVAKNPAIFEGSLISKSSRFIESDRFGLLKNLNITTSFILLLDSIPSPKSILSDAMIVCSNPTISMGFNAEAAPIIPGQNYDFIAYI